MRKILEALSFYIPILAIWIYLVITDNLYWLTQVIIFKCYELNINLSYWEAIVIVANYINVIDFASVEIRNV